MENKLRQHPCMAVGNRPSLSINKNSQAILKTKPKIRIIHIFAPEIIKTDVGNFRELVQRLTGKPTAEKHCKKKPRIGARHQGTKSMSGLQSDKPKMSNMELRNGIWGLDDDQSRERVVMKEEQVGLCNDENSGGYLGGFSDLEGFISELGQIPLLPLDDTHIQGYEQQL